MHDLERMNSFDLVPNHRYTRVDETDVEGAEGIHVERHLQ